MAVELSRSSISRDTIWYVQSNNSPRSYSKRPNLKLVSNNQLQASKAAFNTSMERAHLNQQYWDELLEKLRKSGGGGGGSGNDKSFDRVAVSMMLSNFLSNKTIQAMLRNFGVELFGSNQNSNQTNNANRNVIPNIIQSIGKFILNSVTNTISLIVRRNTPPERLYNQLSTLIGLLSFQLNKLKEILEEDLKEFIKKLDVKEKIKKIKTFVLDFFIEMKKEIVDVVDLLRSKIVSTITIICN